MPPLIEYYGNSTTSVVKQGKYRISLATGTPVVEVVIETDDGMRVYPSSAGHPRLIEMVNAVKQQAGLMPGGQFYINEFQQVIVPATDDSTGNPGVRYYLAGEYDCEIVLRLDDEEFSGRPVRNDGKPMQPGDPWEGRPRPGIGYTLKAGGQDIEYLVRLGPGREKIHRLSRIIGPSSARKTSAFVAKVRGTRGGKFYINEHRAMFCPVNERDFTRWQYIGELDGSLGWYPKWLPQIIANKVTENQVQNQAAVRRTTPSTHILPSLNPPHAARPGTTSPSGDYPTL